jgi:hypothetical protein
MHNHLLTIIFIGQKLTLNKMNGYNFVKIKPD